jgi:Cof subfamily protein (haloacid dehalogenase superfamily)
MQRPAIPSLVEVRLLAIDLDGTLLDDRKQISVRTADAIKSLRHRGIKVVIASARPPRSVRHIFDALKLDTWQINYNGALIWNQTDQKAEFHQPLSGTLVRQILEHARRQFPDVLVSCELLDRWYTDRHDPAYTTQTGKMFKPDVIVPISQFIDVSMTKVMLLGNSHRMSALEMSIGMAFEKEVCIVRTDPDLLQLTDKRVSKSAALQIVADHYGVPMPNVMAIGDAPNDLGMLQLAGVAVAMDNAHPAVKQAADWVAPSNNDHGVHAALVRFGLCN